MNLSKQILIIKLFSRLFSKGYSLQEVLTLMKSNFHKLSIKMLTLLDSGYPLSELFKKCHFKPFVYKTIRIGEQSNKTNEVIKLIESNFNFYLKMKNQFNKVLLYPMFLFIFSLLCFEVIRINLFPIIQSTLNDFDVKQNQFLLFAAFHLLKIIGILMLLIFLLFHLFKKLANVIPYVKCYRSLNITKILIVLISCGYSLEESIKLLNENLNSSIYQFSYLNKLILEDKKIKIIAPYTKSFINYLRLGVSTNNILNTLEDYQEIYLELLIDKLNKLCYYIQFILFTLLSVNIFLIYYIIMIPMFNISSKF